MKKLYLLFLMFFTLGGNAFAQLGSLATDLVYTPVTPCRVFDTRPSQGGSGPIAAAGTKNFYIYGQSTYAGQGGAASNCGITAGSNTAAVALNVTVVTPAAGGFVTAYPFATGLPTAATVNFQAGDIARGNFTIAKINQSGLFDLSVYSTSNADVVGDVVGFYSKPTATALECVSTVAAAALTLPANGTQTIYSAACDAGYTITGGNCLGSNFNANLVTSQVTSNQFFCAYQNSSATTATTVNATARCCRIPGR